jgi:hypothetical protein
MENKKNDYLTKDETLIMKGIAILMMIAYHLFYFPERLKNVSYISLFPFLINNNFVEYWITGFGQMCVSLFLFLSGYGLVLANKKIEYKILWGNSLKKIKSFYINYWIVFLLFIPIGYLIFNLNIVSLEIFLKSIFCLSAKYNGEWWFASYYIQMLVLFPCIYICMEKKWKVVLFISIILGLTYKLHEIKLFAWQLPFVIGMIFVKINGFCKIRSLFENEKNKKIKAVFGIIVLVILRYFIVKKLNIFSDFGLDWLIIPIFIIFSLELFKNLKFLIVLGKHSGNMWLTHSFFCYYYLQKLVFYPKISILVILWTVILSMLSSIIIFKISEKISIIKKNRWKNVS